MRLPALILAAVLGALTLGIGPASAHPHVWVSYAVTLVFEKAKLVALDEEWSFDAVFTSLALRDLPGGTGTYLLAPSDVQILEKSQFANLQNYAYFNHIFVGGSDLGIGGVSNFNAKLADGDLDYTFRVTLKQPLDPHTAPIDIGIWDDSYYVDMEPFADQAVTLTGQGADGCAATIPDEDAHPIFDGAVIPLGIHIACK